MAKTILINNKATTKGTGELHSSHCKPVVCIEKAKTYTSVTDAAKDLGVSTNHLINHLKGKQKGCRGYHCFYLTEMLENMDLVMSRMREVADLEEDARKYREYKAEQDAIREAEEKRIEEERKAKEKHEADIKKAIDKIHRRYEICARIEQKREEAYRRAMEAEKEYEALTGEAYIYIEEKEESEVA